MAKLTLAEMDAKTLSNIDMAKKLEGKDWRTLMGQVPELMGISPQTQKLLTSGYGKPHFVDRAILAARMAGAQTVTEDIARWAGRVEEHHVILMKLLEPFLKGRTISEADSIIKRVRKQLGGRKLGNNPENLVSLIKELHIKNKLSAHGILKRYYDLQGVTAYDEYDQIWKTFPKMEGETVYGKKFDHWYQITKQQDGHSIDMINNIRKMSWEESADHLTGYLDLTIPRLEGAALSSVWLDDTSRRSGYAANLLTRFPNGERHLMETVSDIKSSEMKRWSYNDPSRPVSGTKKVLTDQVRAHTESADILEKIRRFEKEGPYGEVKLSQVEAPPLTKKPTIYPDPTNVLERPPEALRKSVQESQEIASRALGEKTMKRGGKTFIKRFGRWIPVASLGLAYLGASQDVHAATQDPTKANLTRAGLGLLEATAETAAVGLTVAAVPTGGATLPAAGVAKGISTAAGTGNLGSYVVEHRNRIWSTVKDPETYRKLYGNTKDFIVEKATDDKGISSLWHDEEKERLKAYAALNAEGRSR